MESVKFQTSPRYALRARPSDSNVASSPRNVEVVENFPVECRFVLETLKEVYKNEAVARKRHLSPQDRLRFHQKQSGRPMGKLKGWLNRQLRQRLVEPNSGLGQAIQYMLNHWKKLTQFLKTAGAPLGRVEMWRGGLG